MICFDYHKQEWVEGAEGDKVRVAQLTEELALLKGPKGAEYHAFTRTELSRAGAIAAVEDEIAQLVAKANRPESPRGWDAV